jgi:hypothetical protein
VTDVFDLPKTICASKPFQENIAICRQISNMKRFIGVHHATQCTQAYLHSHRHPTLKSLWRKNLNKTKQRIACRYAHACRIPVFVNDGLSSKKTVRCLSRVCMPLLVGNILTSRQYQAEVMDPCFVHFECRCW